MKVYIDLETSGSARMARPTVKLGKPLDFFVFAVFGEQFFKSGASQAPVSMDV